MPRPRLQPTPAPPRPVIELTIALSWPEVELVLDALRDAGTLRTSLADRLPPPALDTAGRREVHLDQASRYALLMARLLVARDRASITPVPRQRTRS